MDHLSAALEVPAVVSRPRRPLVVTERHERFECVGGGSFCTRLEPGDVLHVHDRQGLQPAWLHVFDAAGRSAPGIVGRSASRDAAALLAVLAEAPALEVRLAAAGVQPATAERIDLLPAGAPAGTSDCVVATAACLVVLIAPGTPMEVSGQAAPGELELTIERAVVRAGGPSRLPDPLAEPRLELRVDRCTAAAYEVAAGEYVQIIDVEGQQCSDFLAFDRAAIDAGREVGIDPTATRSLTGRVYPAPGLVSRYFGNDLEPLVEVVQDTCGRHDTFGLACYAKYYEAKGYFGHVNCSDNFNAVLAPRGLATRPGWTAVNLFYNTFLDAHHLIWLDDPWSRPGDHVLLRAARDLVCASSACPDDIDPTNAWNPTDIHVRIYAARQLFSRRVAVRTRPDAPARMTQETAFHPRTAALTRHYTEYRGFWLPTSYTNGGEQAEYLACRERVAVMDLSPLRKFEVTGPDAESLLQLCVTRDVRRLAVGQVVYTAICYPTGGMLDDGTVFRLGADGFRLVCGDEWVGEWLREQATARGMQVHVRHSTSQIHNVAVQGPRSRELLAAIVWTPPTQPTLGELGWFRFLVGRIGSAQGVPLLVSRTGYTGELGYELWCHPMHATTVWDAVAEAGAPLGLSPLGLDALNVLRIEAGLVFAGYEFCDQTDPFEAGIGFAVPLGRKTDDFIGRAALEERSAHPRRVLVGLELEGNEPAAHGDGVYDGRCQVGVVTSATRSPLLAKNVALARVDVAVGRPGTTLEVGKLDGHLKRIAARVVVFPFYDPEKTRVRA